MIQPRKLPGQKRSKEKVEKILTATTKLLGKNGVEGITTNHIAREADISVASLYQYFPNKHAVICAIFQQWLNWIMLQFDTIEEQSYLTIPCEDFFSCLMSGLFENTRFAYGAEYQLSRAMSASPDLAELDRQHGETVARRLAGYLKGYGSSWPEKDLIRIGHLFYQMSALFYEQFGDETIIDRNQLISWYRTMVNALLSDCINRNVVKCHGK